MIKATYDLGLAAALLTFGFELKEIKRNNPQKVQFFFNSDETKEEIEDVCNRYFNNVLAGSFQTFFNNIKTLKNRIYSSE